MTLGKKISALRKQNKLSQEDLAEKLNVSRQSISKWETDTSIPELDKLIILSETFHITLDDLVMHDAIQDTQKTQTAAETDPVIVQKTINTKRNIGIILLCFAVLTALLFAVLGGFLGGLLFCSPFLLCGIICLSCKENTGLWCAWALFLLINLYLRFATGITWRLTLLTLHYEPSMNYVRLAFAWLELFCFIIMIVITAIRFLKKPFILSRRTKTLYIAGWIAFILLFLPLPLGFRPELSYLLFDWLKVGLFTTLLTATLRLIQTRKKARQA